VAPPPRPAAAAYQPEYDEPEYEPRYDYAPERQGRSPSWLVTAGAIGAGAAVVAAVFLWPSPDTEPTGSSSNLPPASVVETTEPAPTTTERPTPTEDPPATRPVPQVPPPPQTRPTTDEPPPVTTTPPPATTTPPPDTTEPTTEPSETEPTPEPTEPPPNQGSGPSEAPEVAPA
jgi:hypothetical protein